MIGRGEISSHHLCLSNSDSSPFGIHTYETILCNLILKTKMNTEAKPLYRGVLCIHCHQPTPLSPPAVKMEKDVKAGIDSGLDEYTLRSFTLRCRLCHGEPLYTLADVKDFHGTPKKRGLR